MENYCKIYLNTYVCTFGAAEANTKIVKKISQINVESKNFVKSTVIS